MRRSTRYSRPGLSGSSKSATLLGADGDGSTLTLDFTTGQLDPRLTFTRASDATFINSSGLVQYADANYFAQSETLSGSPWSTNGVSNTSVAVTNPIGGPDSRLIAVTLSGGSRSILGNATVAAGFQYTIRIWMRAGNSTSAAVGFLRGSFLTVTPSIVSGPGSVSGTTVCTITGLSSTAWTQVQLVLATVTSAGVGGFYVYPNAIANAIGDSVHLWGAQMNIGNTSDPYYATTSSPYYEPRFDHNSSGTRLGLLIEGASTNLITYSDCSTTGWTGLNATGTNNNATAPDNNTAATLWTGGGGGINRAYSATFSITNGTAYTLSVYVKKPSTNAARYAKIDMRSSIEGDVGWPLNGVLDLDTGIASGTGFTATAMPNGWYRIVSTATVNTTTNARAFLRITDATGSISITSTNALLWWGAQVETGTGASSLIPTAASTATRNADGCFMSGGNFSSWYQGGTQGTFYVDWFGGVRTGAAGNTSRTVLSTDDVSTKHLHMLQTAAAGNLRVADFGGANNVTTANTITSGARTKGAFSYNGSTANVCLNGGTVATGSSLAFSVTPTWLVIGGTSTNGTSITDANVLLNNCVRAIKYWPAPLPNATLQSLTA